VPASALTTALISVESVEATDVAVMTHLVEVEDLQAGDADDEILTRQVVLVQVPGTVMGDFCLICR
jgi:hypothetical protein